MKEFTIKNIFKRWLKMWPITIVMVLIGCGAGVYSATTLKPSYSYAMDMLVLNNNSVVLTSGYLSVANSDLTMHEIDMEDCEIRNAQVGDVVTIGVACENEDRAKELVLQVSEKFKSALTDVYKNIDTVNMSQPKLIESTSAGAVAKIKKIAIPTIAMLALSGALAFVVFDYETSKKK